MADKYKVTRLIGVSEDDPNQTYRYSHTGTNKWDCQSLWASAKKAGNNETQIMVFDKTRGISGEWVPDEAAMAYAITRFNLVSVPSGNMALADNLKVMGEYMVALSKKVKKDNQTAKDMLDCSKHLSGTFEQLIKELESYYNDGSVRQEDLEALNGNLVSLSGDLEQVLYSMESEPAEA